VLGEQKWRKRRICPVGDQRSVPLLLACMATHSTDSPLSASSGAREVVTGLPAASFEALLTQEVAREGVENERELD
jgi:hypothetical protein